MPLSQRVFLLVLDGLRPTLGDRVLEGLASEEDAFDLLDRIFKDAVRRAVRDVYLDPESSTTRLRYRLGRRIETVLEFPNRLYSSVLARIKHLASLDTSERRRRQEGLICFTAASGYGGLTVQVLTMPAAQTEWAHLRLHFPLRTEVRH